MMNNIQVGIIGLGFVGGAMKYSFDIKNINVICYDKYKNIGSFNDILNSNILFLALPTVYNNNTGKYNLEPIEETLGLLKQSNYTGPIIIKSTVVPTTTEDLSIKYNLNLVHNPEFLTARTAPEDFHKQNHIVLGKSNICSNSSFNLVYDFYKLYYPNAEISLCSSNESESMKIFVNSFYSVKVQFFNEIYLTCQNINVNYNNVRDLMVKNGWISPMHTQVPGSDGQLSYGGLCFPKDTNALLNFMKNKNINHKVLKATIEERNEMRNDNDNIV